jgi:hypothetical protein
MSQEKISSGGSFLKYVEGEKDHGTLHEIGTPD